MQDSVSRETAIYKELNFDSYLSENLIPLEIAIYFPYPKGAKLDFLLIDAIQLCIHRCMCLGFVWN